MHYQTILRAACVVVMLLVTTGSGADDLFNGSFLQLPPPWYRHVYGSPGTVASKVACLKSLWRQEFEALRVVGVKVVVIQHTLSDNDMFYDGRCDAGKCDDKPLTASSTDIIRYSLPVILQEAERSGIDVWVGLRYRRTWEKNGWPELIKNDSKRFVSENVAVADSITTSLGLDTELIAGWYIPIEIDNRKPAVDAKAVLVDLRKQLKKPVAVSAFFRPASTNLPEPDFLTMLRTSVAGSGIKAVLFQDGVGVAGFTAKSLTDKNVEAIKKRHEDVAAAVAHGGSTTEVWPILEVFKCESCSSPTDAARLQRQYQAAAGFRKRVIFEFSHLLSPVSAVACEKPEVLSLYTSLATLTKVKLCSKARCPS